MSDCERLRAIFCILQTFVHRFICWPYFSPFLVLLLPFFCLIVSYSPFSCHFLLTILPPSTSSYSFYLLLIPLLLQPPIYIHKVSQQISIDYSLIFSLSPFLSFSLCFVCISILPHFLFSFYHIPLHLSFLFIAIFFFWSVSLFLAPPLSSFIIAS